jgi:outer membrane protein TolC
MRRALFAAALGCAAIAHAQPSQSLTFDEAVSKALANNPATAQAKDEIRRAQSVVEEVRAAMLPTLSGNAAGTLLDGARTQGGATVVPQTSLGANVQLAVPLVVPQRWAQTSHAREQVGVTSMSAAEVNRQIAFGAAQAWLTALLQERLVATAARARDVAQAHLDYAHERLTHGVGTRLDESRAEKEVHDDAARVATAQANLARAQEALGVLVGLDGPVQPSGDVTLPEVPGEADALASVDRRSDVAAAQQRLSLAQRVYDDSWLDFLPSLSAVATPFVNTPSTVTTPGTGFQGQLLFSWPLYDGGFRYGAKHEREALRDEARSALEQTERQGHSEVRAALDTLASAHQALTEAEASAKVARETLDLATEAYHAGASTNLEVVDAERNARDADEAVSIARDNESQARLSVVVASGKFPSH